MQSCVFCSNFSRPSLQFFQKMWSGSVFVTYSGELTGTLCTPWCAWKEAMIVSSQYYKKIRLRSESLKLYKVSFGLRTWQYSAVYSFRPLYRLLLLLPNWIRETFYLPSNQCFRSSPDCNDGTIVFVSKVSRERATNTGWLLPFAGRLTPARQPRVQTPFCPNDINSHNITSRQVRYWNSSLRPNR